MFSAQVSTFMTTPEDAATIRAWTRRLNVTHGEMMRAIIKDGLAATVAALIAVHGELPARTYAAILREERVKGEKRAQAGAAAKRGERQTLKAAIAAGAVPASTT